MDVPREDIEEIIAWLETHSLFERAWIFGSRARGDNRDDSDLDLAIQHGAVMGDSDAFTTAVMESKKWQAKLQSKISLTLDLQSYVPGHSKIIEEALTRSSVLIWERL